MEPNASEGSPAQRIGTLGFTLAIAYAASVLAFTSATRASLGDVDLSWLLWIALAPIAAGIFNLLTSHARRRALAGLTMTGLLFLGLIGSSDPTPARFGDATLRRSGPVFLLEVQGSPYEMGLAHGTLLRHHVRRMLFGVLRDRRDRQRLY